MNYARQYPRFWLAYFLFSVLGVAVAVINDVFAFGSEGRSFPLATLLAAIGLRPLYGYIRQRSYDPRWLWTLLLAIAAAAFAAALLICTFLAVCKLSLYALMIGLLLLVTSGPYVLALQQYVFRSQHLWK